jgi:hypothetical protein
MLQRLYKREREGLSVTRCLYGNREMSVI